MGGYHQRVGPSEFQPPTGEEAKHQMVAEVERVVAERLDAPVVV